MLPCLNSREINIKLGPWLTMPCGAWRKSGNYSGFIKISKKRNIRKSEHKIKNYKTLKEFIINMSQYIEPMEGLLSNN